MQWPKILTFLVVFIGTCASVLESQTGDNASADITKGLFPAWQLTTPTHTPNIPPLSHVNLEAPSASIPYRYHQISLCSLSCHRFLTPRSKLIATAHAQSNHCNTARASMGFSRKHHLLTLRPCAMLCIAVVAASFLLVVPLSSLILAVFHTKNRLRRSIAMLVGIKSI